MQKVTLILVSTCLLAAGALALPPGLDDPLDLPGPPEPSSLALLPDPAPPLADVLGISEWAPSFWLLSRLVETGVGAQATPSGWATAQAWQRCDLAASQRLTRRLSSTAVGQAITQVNSALSGAAIYSDLEPFPTRRGHLEQPVDGRVRFPFGPTARRSSRTSVRHPGVTYRVPSESPVRAAARGIVVFAGTFSDYGNLVILDHGSNYHTLYAQLAEIRVDEMQLVEGGDVLGRAASGPRADVYFEIRALAQPLDPADWIRAR